MKKTHLPFPVLALALASPAMGALVHYDAAIDSSGFTNRTTAVSTALTGSNQVAFDFGAISGDATFEFILRGDPIGGGLDGFLAHANADGLNSLRYEQWNDTGELGFTRGGVLDYTFTPAVFSPTVDTHVTYRWLDGTDTMELYLNGAFAGSTTGVSPLFQMPTGPGRLGNNPGNNEGMVGTISRVTTFNSAIAPSEITSHYDAWQIPEPTILACLGLSFGLMLRRRR